MGFNEWMEQLQNFVFWYPFVMSLFWIAGSIIFAIFHEHEKEVEVGFCQIEWPKISILIPCYNEEETISETIGYLASLSYPDFEIIAVNDGSKDKTGDILMSLAQKHEMLRVINCLENKGKANALHIAAHASKSEYLLCVDSDALLEDTAPYYLIRHFLVKGERVGAVTGNPRIRNRDTLLARMQIVEYASIIGSIKRTQRILGKVMTVSGVIVAFRKRALLDVNLWDRDMITEDIAVSWKLQKKFWDIRYEPRALCWMLVPETLRGIWKQRVRWSQGGQEVIIRHFNIFFDYRQRRLWPIYIEQVMSVFWAFAWVFVTLYLFLTATTIREMLIWLSYNSFVLIFISHIQLIISVQHDAKYDNITKYYLWAAWYPAIYWMVNTFVVISATPKAIHSSIKGGYATWNSPDRGSRSAL
ncbi:MAG TPA: poly-beta-1,6 N-acetyl-D-glucosamine synthase [Firmicutes bacterium]|nr:poly-beta-1,6 N-acetyl-D-glucosamine synthase [Bacillota bacterium]